MKKPEEKKPDPKGAFTSPKSTPSPKPEKSTAHTDLEILEEIALDRRKQERKGFLSYFREKLKSKELSLGPAGMKQLMEEYRHYKETKDATLGKYSAYETVVSGATDTKEYYILLILSCLIATVGLYQNSPAVIIGAMIVAPLMGPIFGFSAGVLWGSLRVILEALTTLLKGIIVVLGVTTALSFLIPGITVTGEMAARSLPSLFDTIVALCCGLVGAFAYVNKKISSAIPGVAISVALMPPLCTIGIGLGLGNWELARGAALLFGVNLIGISFSSVLVFYFVKLHPQPENEAEFAKAQKRAARHIIISIIMLCAISVPLVLVTTTTIKARQEQEIILQALHEELPQEKIYNLEIQKGERYTIEVILLKKTGAAVIDMAALETKLASTLTSPVDLCLYTIQELAPGTTQDSNVIEDKTQAPPVFSTAE